MKRIILVEDETLLREGLKGLLSLGPEFAVVAEAADGQEALDLILRTPADVVLMDVRLPYLSGIEILRRLRADGNSIPVVIMSTFNDDRTFLEAMQVGANAFIRKDTSLADLTEILESAMRGERIFRTKVTEAARRGLEAFQPSFPSADLPDPLTRKEIEVLGLMTAGLSNKEIATALNMAEPTVKTHASNILSKFGVRDRVRAVLRGLELGYV